MNLPLNYLLKLSFLPSLLNTLSNFAAKLSMCFSHFHSIIYEKKTHEFMKLIEKNIAERLLKIKAVKLQPNNPFVWASGWKSPIYCDNRKTLSYPAIRTYIKTALVRTIMDL